MTHLPWVMLAKQSAYQSDLKTSPAELVLGSTPKLPPDLIGEKGPTSSNHQVEQLLEGLQTQAAQPAIPTAHHGARTVNHPNLDHITHVFVKRGKTTPLGHSFDGPFLIINRVSNSCIKIRVGSYANGDPKYEIQHWANCKPAHLAPNTTEAARPKVGRKLNPKAKPFKPAVTGPLGLVKNF